MKKRTWRGLTILLAVALLIGVLAVTAFAEGEEDALPEVQLTSIAPYGDGIVIRWEAVEEADLYEVYSKCEDGEWSKLANTRSTAYKDTTAEDNRIYSYTVLARNGDRVSPWNEDNCLTVKKGLDDVVMGEAQPHVTGNIIRWNAVENAVFYQVLRLNPGETTWTLLRNTSGTAYKDETAEIGVKYYYKVRARNGSLMSSMNIQSVSAMRPIGNVQMGETTSHYTGNIVRWEAVDGAKLYQVYRLPSGGSQWSLLAKTSGTAYKDTSAEFGTKYYYKTVAVCNSAVGSLNNVSSVSAIRPPENVTLIRAEADSSGITIYWVPVENATEYEILRRTDGQSWKHYAYASQPSSYTDKVNWPDWGVTFYYSVKACVNSTWSAGYDTEGVSARVTVDEEAIEALHEALKKRIEMEKSGEYSLNDMASKERVILDAYITDKEGIFENMNAEKAFRSYYDAIVTQIEASIECKEGSRGLGELMAVKSFLACSQAVTDLYEEGWFTDSSDADIRENYMDTLPEWKIKAEVYQELYDDLSEQLVGTEWNSSSDGKQSSHTYTNYTNYTITTDIKVVYQYVEDGILFIGHVNYSISNLAPGSSTVIKLSFFRKPDTVIVGWSHVKIAEGSTVIVDHS